MTNELVEQIARLEAKVTQLEAEKLNLKEQLELKHEIIYWPSDDSRRILTYNFAFSNRDAMLAWEVDYKRVTGFGFSLHQTSRIKVLDDWSVNPEDLPF